MRRVSPDFEKVQGLALGVPVVNDPGRSLRRGEVDDGAQERIIWEGLRDVAFDIDPVLDEDNGCLGGDGWADLVGEAGLTARKGLAADNNKVVGRVLSGGVDVWHDVGGVEIDTAIAHAVHVEAMDFDVGVIRS